VFIVLSCRTNYSLHVTDIIRNNASSGVSGPLGTMSTHKWATMDSCFPSWIEITTSPRSNTVRRQSEELGGTGTALEVELG